MTTFRVGALVCAGWLAGLPALAQAPATVQVDVPLVPRPVTPDVALTQRLDARLPLDAAFTDSAGRVLRLGDEFDGRSAVIVVLGYYRCPQLCGLLTQGLLEAGRATRLPTSVWRVVFASIDPAETPADAATRRRMALDYARFLGDVAPASAPPRVAALVGSPASIAALTRSVGYTFEAAAPAQAARYAHPAGIVVATPDGRVSRYLMGVRFDADELRAALVEAEGGRVGTLTERLALLCAHVDPRAGRWTPGVLAGMRVLGLATLASLGLLVWRHTARVRKEPR
jgi:protein SCO1/2